MASYNVEVTLYSPINQDPIAISAPLSTHVEVDRLLTFDDLDQLTAWPLENQ